VPSDPRPTPTAAHLGTSIRRLRTDRGLTLEDVAKDAGIHWTYLSGIERGGRNPTWKVLGSVAWALGVLPSELAREAEAVCETEMRPG
jgi:transcriptional regulator with XRE-family HTH domain